MGQSLVKNYLHLVFSTKLRNPIILPSCNLELYSYLGGICNNLDSQVVRIGGYSDHVHVLCMLSKKIALAKLLEELKSHSSKWMKSRDQSLKNFSWQDGYGAFSNMMKDTFGISYFALSGLEDLSSAFHRASPCVDKLRPFRVE